MFILYHVLPPRCRNTDCLSLGRRCIVLNRHFLRARSADAAVNARGPFLLSPFVRRSSDFSGPQVNGGSTGNSPFQSLRHAQVSSFARCCCCCCCFVICPVRRRRDSTRAEFYCFRFLSFRGQEMGVPRGGGFEDRRLQRTVIIRSRKATSFFLSGGRERAESSSSSSPPIIRPLRNAGVSLHRTSWPINLCPATYNKGA